MPTAKSPRRPRPSTADAVAAVMAMPTRTPAEERAKVWLLRMLEIKERQLKGDFAAQKAK